MVFLHEAFVSIHILWIVNVIVQKRLELPRENLSKSAEGSGGRGGGGVIKRYKWSKPVWTRFVALTTIWIRYRNENDGTDHSDL